VTVYFFEPAVRVRGHPERVIRTLYDAQRCLQALGPGRAHNWERLLSQMQAVTNEQLESKLAEGFKEWLRAEGLLETPLEGEMG